MVLQNPVLFLVIPATFHEFIIARNVLLQMVFLLLLSIRLTRLLDIRREHID